MKRMGIGDRRARRWMRGMGGMGLKGGQFDTWRVVNGCTYTFCFEACVNRI